MCVRNGNHGRNVNGAERAIILVLNFGSLIVFGLSGELKLQWEFWADSCASRKSPGVWVFFLSFFFSSHFLVFLYLCCQCGSEGWGVRV